MTLIKVKVFPGSKKTAITQKAEDSFEIKVKGKAERGEANKEASAALAAYLNIPAKTIKIIKGAKSPNKIFSIRVSN
ncbi:MAG: DUF167 domain-containing protein [Candidatus Pacebacteria bacterium]|nr:DUF167 domain-containing protein [Candidatus Paceibacterota bacterium]